MQIHDRPTLSFYAQPAAMTSPGRYATLLEGLPRDVASLATIGHGLMIHEHIAPAYGVTLSDQDRGSVHLRPVERLLETIVDRDPRPLTAPRAPAERVAGNCRHFTVLLVTMLRAQGIPARARCGFGGYFGTGTFEDHWVCEYWHAERERWVLADAQIDDRQRELFGIDFDLTDVPRDRFVIAGQAWEQCRAGAADPGTFGLKLMNEAGYWWIAGNLMRDAAALGNLELLPWDVWGAMPAPDEPIDDDRRALFDRLAALTRTPHMALVQRRRRNQVVSAEPPDLALHSNTLLVLAVRAGLAAERIGLECDRNVTRQTRSSPCQPAGSAGRPQVEVPEPVRKRQRGRGGCRG